jgi:acetyl esterase/lipase
MVHFRTIASAFILCLFLASTASAQPKPPADIAWEPGVTYGKAGDVELKLNLARPAKHDDKSDPIPAIVVIHGGGWAAGHRDQFNDFAWKLAQRGYLAVTISYRFAPKHLFPAQVEDAKCAVRFLRANAKKYHINPDRIGAVGGSAGAHLAMMLATMDKADGMEGDGGNAEQASKVQAAVSFVGPTDLTVDDLPKASQDIIKNWLGGDLKEKAAEAKKASPITYLNKGDAPMLLFQGTVDPLIPNTQAYRMAEAMTKAGVKGRVELILGGGHGWIGKELERTMEETYRFFDEHLKK